MAYDFEAFQKFGKEQFEAASAAMGEVAKGLQAIATEATDYSKKSFADSSALVEKLVGVKKLDEAISRSDVPLRFGTVVVFTDGTDRAARVTANEMGDASHDAYKRRQQVAVARRLKVGVELPEPRPKSEPPPPPKRRRKRRDA